MRFFIGDIVGITVLLNVYFDFTILNHPNRVQDWKIKSNQILNLFHYLVFFIEIWYNLACVYDYDSLPPSMSVVAIHS